MYNKYIDDLINKSGISREEKLNNLDFLKFYAERLSSIFDDNTTLTEMKEVLNKAEESLKTNESSYKWGVFNIRDEDGYELFPEIYREDRVVNNECNKASLIKWFDSEDEAKAYYKKIF